MGDPYYRYAAATADRGSVSRPSFPDYFSSEAPSLESCHTDMQAASSHINQSQYVGYGMNDISNSGVYPEPILGNVSAGATIRAYPSSLEDRNSIDERWHTTVGVNSSTHVHPGPSNFGGVSAGAAIRGYPSAPAVPTFVGHRWDAAGINPSAEDHHEPIHGSLSAATTMRDPNLVGQRQDGSVGISPSAVVRAECSYGPALDGATAKGYSSSSENPNLIGQRQDAPVVVNDMHASMRNSDSHIVDEKHASMRNSDGAPAADGESNILFVDGLPTDCTRREVGHLFRPFVGYKDIKVVHKEPRCSGDRAMVLCFVEFHDSKYARTAMQALQGYKFDDKKPESPALRIQFAHFPFRYRADRDQRVELQH